VLIGGILEHEESRASGFEKDRGATGTRGRIAAACFGWVVNDQTGNANALDECLDEYAGQLGHGVFGEVQVRVAENGGEWINNHQLGLDTLNGLGQRLDVIWELEWPLVALASLRIDDGKMAERDNPAQVRASSLEPGVDGIVESILGGDQDDTCTACNAWSAVGHLLARAHAGGEVEREMGFAQGAITFQGGHFSQRETVLPEPLDLFALHVGEQCAHRSWGLALWFLFVERRLVVG